nr:immunoglobulin heavy chain junction region [Mus musculus]
CARSDYGNHWYFDVW